METKFSELHRTAVLTPVTDPKGRKKKKSSSNLEPITVQFNPETLDITYSNSLKNDTDKKQPAQVVSEATAKLSMDLIFDTTTSGQGEVQGGKDVRTETNKIVKLLDPTQISSRRKSSDETKIPSIVKFEWGTILFEGYIDSLKEKLELFSPLGIPLRATVSISMTQQKRSFDPVKLTGRNIPKGGLAGALDLGKNPAVQRISPKKSMTHFAQANGDITGARRLAILNGIEDLRHPEVIELIIEETIERQSSGIIQVRSGRSGGSSFNLPGSTESLFTQLQSQTNPAHSLVPRNQLSADVGGLVGDQVGIGSNTTFGLGGEVDTHGSASISADVGVGADFKLGIQFEE